MCRTERMIVWCAPAEKEMIVGESGGDDCDVPGEGDGCGRVWR
jgi:hypothetical protein